MRKQGRKLYEFVEET
ncbi:hypothetical protein RDABS01_009909 [Bienertia sinuspersici]